MRYGGLVKEGIPRLRYMGEEEVAMVTPKHHGIDSTECVVDREGCLGE